MPDYNPKENRKKTRKQYYEKNKEYLNDCHKKYWKKYYAENKEYVKEYKKEYNARPEVKARKNELNAQSYEKNKEKVKIRHKNRQEERALFIDNIASKYGCQNPNCKWKHNFFGILDFHHFNPCEKTKELAKMKSYSYNKIIEEINKCVVLCKNCHALAHSGKIIITESMKCKEIYG